MRMVMHSGAALQPKSHGHNNEGGQQAQHGGERVFQMGSALLWHGMHTRAALREQNVSPDLLTRLCTARSQAQQNHLPSLQDSQGGGARSPAIHPRSSLPFTRPRAVCSCGISALQPQGGSRAARAHGLHVAAPPGAPANAPACRSGLKRLTLSPDPVLSLHTRV